MSMNIWSSDQEKKKFIKEMRRRREMARRLTKALTDYIATNTSAEMVEEWHFYVDYESESAIANVVTLKGEGADMLDAIDLAWLIVARFRRGRVQCAGVFLEQRKLADLSDQLRRQALSEDSSEVDFFSVVKGARAASPPSPTPGAAPAPP